MNPYYGLRSYGTEPQVWGQTCCEHPHEWESTDRFSQSSVRLGGRAGLTSDHPRDRVLRGARCRHVHDWHAATAAPGNTLRNGQGASRLEDHGADGRSPYLNAVHETPRTGGATCDCGAWLGELGSEPTPELYLEHVLAIFRELRRVLRPDGTLWLDIGDSYAGSGNPGLRRPQDGSAPNGSPKSLHSGRTSHKNLLGMPWRVALALQADGWIWRSTIVWSKTSSMPESVRDRPSNAWEPILLFSRRPRYFYDADAVREDAISDHPSGNGYVRPQRLSYADEHGPRGQTMPWIDVGGKRNMRNVWRLGPEPVDEPHFAAFPTEVPRRAIAAGTSDYGACAECGAPWRRLTETRQVLLQRTNNTTKHSAVHGWDNARWPRTRRLDETTGWLPTCAHYDARYRAEYPQARSARKRAQRATCGDWWRRVRRQPGQPHWPTVPCVVLDPFMGSGQTAIAADRLGRDCIGIELLETYAKMAQRRLKADQRARWLQDRLNFETDLGQLTLFELNGHLERPQPHDTIVSTHRPGSKAAATPRGDGARWNQNHGRGF